MSILNFNEQHKLILRLGYKKIFIISLFAILFSSYLFSQHGESLPRVQERFGIIGLDYKLARHFVYFFYYKNLFPVSSLADSTEVSETALNNIIRTNGESLVMDRGAWSRLGENSRIFTFLPAVMMSDKSSEFLLPSVTPFNIIFFLTGLIILLYSFFKIGLPLFGMLIPAIFLCTPFFVYEVYQNQNIFGLLASTAMISLGLNLRFVFNKKIRKLSWLLPPLCGLLIAFTSDIRGENIVVLGSCILIYLLTKSLNASKKILYLSLLVGTFLITSIGISKYFEYKFNQAYSFVEKSGGHPYKGSRIKTHALWHPVFCGLGDYDTKYGLIEFNDHSGYKYALPELKEKYGLEFNYSENDLWFLREYYDKDSLYLKVFDLIPEYQQVLKDKIINIIKNDPVWYLEILFKRTLRILNETIPFPYLGWLLIPILLIVLYYRKWGFLNLLIYTLPLSLTPFLIYSGAYSTYNSIFPIFSLAILLAIILEYFIKKSWYIPFFISPILLFYFMLKPPVKTDLDETTARNIIEKQFNLPKSESTQLHLVKRIDTLTPGSLELFDKLQNSGLLTYYYKERDSVILANLTEKGREYIIDSCSSSVVNIKLGELIFDDIEKILIFKQFNLGEMNYTLMRKNVTPFGHILYGMKEQQIKRNAKFDKWEGEWYFKESY